VPTSKRPQIINGQYLRIPSRTLKGASHEEVVNDDTDEIMSYPERVECTDTQISCIAAKSLAEPLEVCRPQEGLKTKAPKHPETLGRAIRHAPHREAFIPDVKNLGCPEKAGRAYESTPTSEDHASRAPNKVGKAIVIPKCGKT
jgi:hypothetical protein